MSVQRLKVDNAPDPAGAYSAGVIANGFLFTAGMGPIDSETGQIVGDEVGEQTRQVLRNLGTVLAEAGLDYSDVVKATSHLSDIVRDFADYNRAYAEFFPDGPPARTTVGSALPNILVEIDFVAALR
ncbi:MAG TPA: Rid family hydrolase [Egibacteraceae bacterium]|nr:Rid family hydrolase [Egibacteraceae bacterium]